MKTLLLFILAIAAYFSKAQQLYFPPLAATAEWQTTSPASLGWCTDKIDSLYAYLQSENSKAFIVLKDGKMVLEKYFGTFTKDSLWYWASAGKSLTSLLIGKAQEEGFLSIDDSSSKYLGIGWTACPPAEEGLITIRNQLTMTSGLDDGVADNHCTIDSCMIFKARAGTRWAYHNAPYTLLDSVIYRSTGQTINAFTNTAVKTKTGMNGLWFRSGYDNVFASTPRSMARYGLLAQNHFIWNTDTILHDTAYARQMTQTSQNYNLSYGYLWWLNGKNSFMVPGSQFVIPGSFATNAPPDMFAAIGKNGQIVSISRSKGLVLVRMGDAPESFGEVPFALCDSLWSKLNKVMCMTTGLNVIEKTIPQVNLVPNPAHNTVKIQTSAPEPFVADMYNLLGEKIATTHADLDISMVDNGVYFLQIKIGSQTVMKKLVKN